MEEVWGFPQGGGGWDPRFVRPFKDLEVEVVERVLSTIQGKKVFLELEKEESWRESKKLSVKSLYEA